VTWERFVTVHLAELLVACALLACSGFCSGTETAMFSLSRGRLMRLAQGGATGRAVAALMKDPVRVLNTLLLSNMVVNVAYSGICAVIVIDLGRQGSPPWLITAASILPLVLLILLGESTPKMLAMVFAEPWALWTGPIVLVLERVLAPALWVLNKAAIGPLTKIILPGPRRSAEITTEELGAVLELSGRRGLIDRNASAFLQEILALTHLRVCDIMVPRVDMIAYDVDQTGQGLMDLFRRTRLRKVPVYEGTIDKIIGLIHAKRLFLSPHARLRELVSPVLFVPETANVERMLVQFRVRRAQMAIVVDEYGGTAGLVTLKDIMEQIVGDIRDGRPFGASPAVEKKSDREYLIDGDLPIHEWADAFKMGLAGHRITTIGGFVIAQLQRIPRVGDTVTYRNLRFTVLSLRGRRIEKLHLTLEGTP